MGTLSGGGTEQVISIGERSLIGANAGIGISLGDDSVVEAGCYVTAGVEGDPARRPGREGRASCPGRDGLLFRRNSVTGALEAVAADRHWGSLNAALHAND